MRARKSPDGIEPGLDVSDWSAATETIRAARVPWTRRWTSPYARRASCSPKSMTESEPGPVDFRPGTEHGRLCPAESFGAGWHEDHVCAMRRCSIRTATIYTKNLRGAPSIDTYICKGGGVETWQPRFTFHGFRYVELDRPVPASRQGRGHGHRHWHGHPAHGRVRLLESRDQPASIQHPVGHARQLPGRAHRLPAARRTHGLDGRCGGIHPHGDLQRRRRRVLHQMAGRCGRRADRRTARLPM